LFKQPLDELSLALLKNALNLSRGNVTLFDQPCQVYIDHDCSATALGSQVLGIASTTIVNSRLFYPYITDMNR